MACGAEARPHRDLSGAAGQTAGDTLGGAGAGGIPNIGTAGAAPSSSGAAGADPAPAGAAGRVGTVPSGAGGSVDLGYLFTDASAVTSASTDAGSSSPDATSGDAGAKSAPGDGNVGTCHVGGMNYLLVFTQRGTDVTMVVTASNCSNGNHTIQLHDGFSCDNASTELGVWDGKRGIGIPALVCANNKGTLTYTRTGADPTTNWTVGDHATKTDVTLHPMSVDSSCGTFF